ncbi:MAG: AraC family transcriptional regulator [Cyanobacteria bacterium J06581_3]
MKNTLSAEFSQLWNSSIPGVELFEARFTQHRFGKHFHEGYTIGLNEFGQGRCLHRGQIHFHHPGSFNCINPGEMHTGEVSSAQGWAFRNLYISVSAIQQILRQLNLPGQPLPCFSNIIVNDAILRALFYRLFQALDDPVSQLEPQSLLLRFLFLLFTRDAHFSPQTLASTSTAPKQKSKAVVIARDYLRVHCTKDISIDALAALVDLNPFYFIRCFHQQVGVSPHSYKQHWQLLSAKQALSTEQSLSEISLAYGFYDQSHFTRAFKRTFGVTPGRYRKVNFIQDRSR